FSGDWDLALGRWRPRSDWVAVALSLAHVLLDAPGVVPVELPSWLVPAVLKRWEAPLEKLGRGSLGHGLASRWFNPLWYTERWNGPLSRMPHHRLAVEQTLSSAL